MRVINGRWVSQHGDKLTTPQQHQDFADKLNRVKQFSSGRSLTHRKIEVLFKILDTNETTDGALTKLLTMNKKEIKNLCLV